MPRVSIIIASYNHEQFVPLCVESVLSQSFDDWELIVVDDRSADDSVAIFRNYNDPRIQVFVNETNLGTYGTQNRGVELASGDLIAILNSDDWWEPRKLELQVEALDRHPDAQVCYTLGWKAEYDGTPIFNFDNHGDWPTGERDELAPHLIECNNVLASSVVFRKAWADFDESLRYSGDWIALLKACCGSKPICISDRLTYWRQHDNNASQLPIGVTREEIRVRRAIWKQARWFRQHFDSKLVDHKLGLCLMHLCALYLLWGNRRFAMSAALGALRFLPDKIWALRRMLTCLLPTETILRRLFPRTNVRPRWSEWNQSELDLRLRTIAERNI